MYTKSFKWHRWAGPRSTLVRLIEASIEEVSRWCGYAASCSVRIAYDHDLTETATTPDVLSSMSERDVARIKSLWITVRPDFQEGERLRTEALNKWLSKPQETRGDEPERPHSPHDAEVDISVDREWTAVSVSVKGLERPRVEGLASRLDDMLGGSSRLLRLYPPILRPAIPLTLFFTGLIGGGLVAGTHGEGIQWQEMAGLLVGALAGLFIGLLALWLVPILELLPEQRPSRLLAARRWLVSAVIVGAVIAAIGTFLYEKLA